MQEPGIDVHAWESEWQALEPLLADGPAEALPEADALVARMMAARGYDLEVRTDETLVEPETTLEFTEARRITRLLEAGEVVDPGDVGAAAQAYRTLYERLRDLGPTAGEPA